MYRISTHLYHERQVHDCKYILLTTTGDRCRYLDRSNGARHASDDIHLCSALSVYGLNHGGMYVAALSLSETGGEP